MADVSVVSGTEQTFVRGGFPTEQNDRANAPVRDDRRIDDEANRPSTADEASGSEESSPQPQQVQPDDGAQQNRASTGDQDAGGADRQADSVVISAEAQDALRADRPSVPDQPAAAENGPVAAASNSDATTASRTETRSEAGEAEPTAGGRDDAERPGAAQPAVSAGDPSATATANGTDGPARTNQAVRDENSNAEVNGSTANQSEQTRTLGQVLDVFA